MQEHSFGMLKKAKRGVMIHEHPFKILKHAKNSIWLLIFPVLRGIRSFSLDLDAFYTWIKGGWFDLCVLIIILGFGYLQWLFTWVRLGRNHVRLMSGIIFKRRVEIPYKNISAITAQHSFFLRPFKAVTVNIDTGAGALDTTDMSILLYREDLKKIQRKLPKIKKDEKKSFKFRPKWYQIVFFSFVFSSSLSGAAYLATLIFNAGKVITDLMSEDLSQMYEIANNMSHNVSEKTPVELPTEALILIIIVLGTWLLSFISNIFMYLEFVMKKDTHVMRILSGVFTKRVYHIIPEKINYLDLRQSLITKLFKVSSLNISCSGYGKKQLPVLLPVLTRKQANEALEMMGFNKYLVKRKVKPEKPTFMSYCWIPLFIAACIFIASRVILHYFPGLSDMMFYIVLILEIPFIWLAIVKFYAYLTTGITIEDDYCCIRYSRFYAFHTILADKNKLVKIQLFQDIIDKKIGRCRLDFYFSSEKARVHKVKGLRVKDAQKIMEQLGVISKDEDINKY